MSLFVLNTVSSRPFQSATVSSDSSSGEEEVDGFDIDEVDPMPDEWRQKYRHLGKEGTRAA